MVTIAGKILHSRLVTLNAALSTLLDKRALTENDRGVMSQGNKDRHKEIDKLRKTRMEIQGEIATIKGLIGNLKGRDKEIKLTQSQLDHIKELEARISDTVTQLDKIAKDDASDDPYTLDSLEASQRNTHHNIPGAAAAGIKFNAIQDILHAKTYKDITDTFTDKRSEAIAKSDLATRALQTTVYHAAEGDVEALKRFYTNYFTERSPSWKKFRTPEGAPVKTADDFAAHMNARPPEQRAELIYRWSEIPKEVAKKAASIPPGAPLTEDDTPILSAAIIHELVSAASKLLREKENLDEWEDTVRGIDAIDQTSDDPDAVDWIQGDSSRSVIRPSEQDYARG
jgi:hypothetical protein